MKGEHDFQSSRGHGSVPRSELLGTMVPSLESTLVQPWQDQDADQSA